MRNKDFAGNAPGGFATSDEAIRRAISENDSVIVWLKRECFHDARQQHTGRAFPERAI